MKFLLVVLVFLSSYFWNYYVYAETEALTADDFDWIQLLKTWSEKDAWANSSEKILQEGHTQLTLDILPKTWVNS